MNDADRGAETLRLALKVNGVFSGLSGLVLVVSSTPLAGVLGVTRWVLVGIGVGLLLFAASLWRSASRPQLSPAEGRIAVWADVSWVAGTVLVAITGVLTPTGVWLVAAVAVVVLAFAVWQQLGLRRLSDPGGSTTSAR